MSQQPRYRRTERRQARPVEVPREIPYEQEAEERGRYGSFTTIMVAGLALATVVAIIAAAIFWPD